MCAVIVQAALTATIKGLVKRDLPDIDLIGVVRSDGDDVVEAELSGVVRRRGQFGPIDTAIARHEQAIDVVRHREARINNRLRIRKADSRSATERERNTKDRGRRQTATEHLPLVTVEIGLEDTLIRKCSIQSTLIGICDQIVNDHASGLRQPIPQ
jgi:hypothetical protein